MAIVHKSLKGGHSFGSFEGQPREEVSGPEISGKVIISLKQRVGDAVSATVKPGDPVRAGQIVGRNDDNVSSPVLSSVNGTVDEVSDDAVVISSDGTDGWDVLEGHSSNWETLDREKVEDLLYLSGAAGLGSGGIPTRHRSSALSPGDVKDIIVRDAESEPYHLSVSALLRNGGVARLTEGLKILKRIMPDAPVHLALNWDRADILKDVSRLLSTRSGFYLRSVEPKYPQDFDEVIIPTLLGRKVPARGTAADAGVVVLDIQTVLQVRDAVVEGRPVIERTIALCGTGFASPSHVRVRIGTPLKDVVDGRLRSAVDSRILLNSPLTGAPVSDLSIPVDRGLSQVIALPEDTSREFLSFVWPGLKKDSYARVFASWALWTPKAADTNLKGEPRPCVFCNFCQDVCPAGIIPHLLSSYAARGFIEDALLDLRIHDCFECGLCSYVCPCKVPVARNIVEGKRKLAEEGMGS